MPWYRLKHKVSGDVMHVSSLDGWDSADWDNVTLTHEPTDTELQIAAVADDPIAAEVRALEIIEGGANREADNTISHLRRQIAIDRAWNEIQRLKLAQATGNIPTDLTERRKMFPTLMALVVLSGNTLAAVSTAMEMRLWERVKRMAVIEARLLRGHDAVRSATTPEAKIQAAKNSDWSDT